MKQQQQHRSSATRSGAVRVSSPPDGIGKPSLDRFRGGGIFPFPKSSEELKMPVDSSYVSEFISEEDSFSLEFRRSLPSKASGRQIKTLKNEMSMNKDNRRPSPNIVARLMGLDALPDVEVHNKHHKDLRVESLSSCFQENMTSYEHQAPKRSAEAAQNFKDVFEIDETLRSAKNKDHLARRVKSSSKRSEIVIREKFTDSKQMSSGEAHRKSKEFDDALMLDSSKGMFMKFLHEPNSLFHRHLQELKCCPPPRSSYITILKSSIVDENKVHEQRPEMQPKAERHSKRHYGKTRPRKESGFPLLHATGKPSHPEESDGCPCPTRIVVLKPCLEEINSKPKTILSRCSTGDFHLGYERHSKCQNCGLHELYAEGTDLMMKSNHNKTVRVTTKNSRDIAQEVTEHMRHTVSSNAKKVKTVLDSENNERKRLIPGKNESVQWTSECYDERNVIREGRKHLSERLKISNRLEDGAFRRGSSTLGEMLASPGRTKQKPTLGQFNGVEKLGKERLTSMSHRLPDGRIPKSASLLPFNSSSLGSKLGARSKTPCSSNSNVVSGALSLGIGDSLDKKHKVSTGDSLACHDHVSSKPDSYNLGVEENDLIERDIHVAIEVLRDDSGMSFQSEISDVPINPESAFNREDCLVDKFWFTEARGEDLNHQISSLGELASTPGPCNFIRDKIIYEDFSFDHQHHHHHHQVGHFPACCQSVGLSSSVSDQDGSVSVLEPRDGEASTSSCFHSISADLRELRMQLHLLRSSSSETHVMHDEAASSTYGDEDDRDDFLPDVSDLEKDLHPFLDKEDRDYQYLVDVLTSLGFHCMERWEGQGVLHNACSVIDDERSLKAFYALENKFGMLDSWTKLERKLLFDLINTAVVEILSLFSKQSTRPVWPFQSLECFAEKVRQQVVDNKSFQEAVLEPKWFDLNEEVDLIGMEIEEAVGENILEELLWESIVF